MASDLTECSKHNLPQQVITKGQTGVELICIDCFIRKNKIYPHIILNEYSSQFFEQWTNTIIQHYESILLSAQDNFHSLQVFNISGSLCKRITEEELRTMTKQILISQIEVLKGNIQYIQNIKSISDLANQFFMIDLLNIFNESGINNFKNLITMIKAKIVDKGALILSSIIQLQEGFIGPLQNQKELLKSRYFKEIQVTKQLSTKWNTPKKQIQFSKESINTVKKTPSFRSEEAQIYENNKPRHLVTTQNSQFQDFYDSVGYRQTPKINLILEKLEEENNRLRDWKTDFQHYLKQMTQQISDLSPINSSRLAKQKSVQQSAIMKTQKNKALTKQIEKQIIEKLEFKIKIIQQKYQQQNKLKNQLLRKILQLESQIKQTKLKTHYQQLQLDQAQIMIKANIQKYQQVAQQFEQTKYQLEETLKQVASQKQINNSKFQNENKQIKRLRQQLKNINRQNKILNQNLEDKNKQNKTLRQQLQSALNINSEILKQIEELKKDNQNRLKSSIVESRQKSEDSVIKDKAQDIKEKMNQINTIIRISSTPQLSSKKTSTQFNNIHLESNQYNVISEDGKETTKTDFDKNLTILKEKIEQKNNEINNLVSNNQQLQAIGNQLRIKIEQVEKNSNQCVLQLQRKVKQNINQIEIITKQKDQYEGQVDYLKHKIDDIASVKDQMEVKLNNKDNLIKKLNEKINYIEHQISSRKEVDGQALKQLLLEQVIQFQAQLKKIKMNLVKVLQICTKITNQLQQEDVEVFQQEIDFLDSIKKQLNI